jgi:tRNA A22 N-methylase
MTTAKRYETEFFNFPNNYRNNNYGVDPQPRLNTLSLSNRLQSIVSFVKPKSTVADVACHHAHVAVQLVLNKIASRVIGTELTEGSWRVACDTVHKYQVQQYVDIRLGDGKDTLFSTHKSK